MSAFQTYFVDTIKNRYADFEGRATRSEYWYFALFQMLCCLIPMGLAMGLGGAMQKIGMGLYALIALALLVPSLALAIRRLHDTGRSGWWLLIALVPFVGGIILLVFLVTDSKPGSNQFGADPKAATRGALSADF